MKWIPFPTHPISTWISKGKSTWAQRDNWKLI
ncbi:hypothetical protein ERO13_A09G164150v2 [Gossypium hirsutum]|nr:hypothetical protein ERO13_A09G164150v2 [Gossypium hirsutum]